MMVTKRNVYHPFVNKSLAFLINSKRGTSLDEILTDVDLYWQPVPDPKYGLAIIVINVIAIIAGCFVHYHLWQMLKREANLVSNILKAYVVFQLIIWPFSTGIISATSFIYPLCEITGSWLCEFTYFLMFPSIYFISFQATVIATMRYFFIVHHERVVEFGKQRTQNLFQWILGIVPIVMTIWLYFGSEDTDLTKVMVINRCRGSYDKIFHLNWSYTERKSILEARCGMYNNDEGTAYYIHQLKWIQCTASTILSLVLLTNILDGFIYYRIWKHITKE